MTPFGKFPTIFQQNPEGISGETRIETYTAQRDRSGNQGEDRRRQDQLRLFGMNWICFYRYGIVLPIGIYYKWFCPFRSAATE